MPELIVGINQYSSDLYAWLKFGHENHSDEWHFIVLAILQVEKQWAKVSIGCIRKWRLFLLEGVELLDEL